VKWRTKLSRPPVGLESDALGRFLFYGLSTGEVCRIDLDGRTSSRTTSTRVADPATPPRPRSSSIRNPDFRVPLATTDDQAETAVLAVLDDPGRIAAFTNTAKMQVFSAGGKLVHAAPECPGVGRILRTSPGWIAAATDRNVVLYDARKNVSQRLDLSLVELTHLVIRPGSFGLATVQERDRIGRATPAGRWMWRHELRSPVEDLAVGIGNVVAVSTDSGQLLVFDAAGEAAGEWTVDPPEALSLIDAPEESPAGVAWLTLARRNQVLRGHTLDGRVVWESPVPWEGWLLHRVGAAAVVSAPDGQAIAYDGSGHVKGQSRSEESISEFFAGPEGEVLRVAKQGVHLICSDLSGRVRWRTVSDGGLGGLGCGSVGVAAMLGRDLGWFSGTIGR
jgi:hypothetical protein